MKILLETRRPKAKNAIGVTCTWKKTITKSSETTSPKALIFGVYVASPILLPNALRRDCNGKCIE